MEGIWSYGCLIWDMWWKIQRRLLRGDCGVWSEPIIFMRDGNFRCEDTNHGMQTLAYPASQNVLFRWGRILKQVPVISVCLLKVVDKTESQWVQMLMCTWVHLMRLYSLLITSTCLFLCLWTCLINSFIQIEDCESVMHGHNGWTQLTHDRITYKVWNNVMLNLNQSCICVVHTQKNKHVIAVSVDLNIPRCRMALGALVMCPLLNTIRFFLGIWCCNWTRGVYGTMHKCACVQTIVCFHLNYDNTQ